MPSRGLRPVLRRDRACLKASRNRRALRDRSVMAVLLAPAGGRGVVVRSNQVRPRWGRARAAGTSGGAGRAAFRSRIAEWVPGTTGAHRREPLTAEAAAGGV